MEIEKLNSQSVIRTEQLEGLFKLLPTWQNVRQCPARLLTRKQYIGPLNFMIMGDEDRIEWVKHTRLLGVTSFPSLTMLKSVL